MHNTRLICVCASYIAFDKEMDWAKGQRKEKRKKESKQYFCIAAIRSLCLFNTIVEQLFLIGHTKSFVQIVLLNKLSPLKKKK
jgi:hypothetical protein